jgi:hypothetical protein
MSGRYTIHESPYSSAKPKEMLWCLNMDLQSNKLLIPFKNFGVEKAGKVNNLDTEKIS